MQKNLEEEINKLKENYQKKLIELKQNHQKKLEKEKKKSINSILKANEFLKNQNSLDITKIENIATVIGFIKLINTDIKMKEFFTEAGNITLDEMEKEKKKKKLENEEVDNDYKQ